MRNEKRERLFKGIITLLILRSIWFSPKHGYNLENEISEKIGERLSEGEIYSLMKHMEIRGFVSSYTRVENGRMRRYYEIKKEGKTFFLRHRIPLEKIRPLTGEILEFMNSLEKDESQI